MRSNRGTFYDCTDRLDYHEFRRDSTWHESAPFEVMAGWIYRQTDSYNPIIRMIADGSGQPQTEPFE